MEDARREKKEEDLYSLREWKPPSSREKKKEEEKPKAKKEDESPRRKMAGKERAPRTQSEEKDNRKGAKTLEKVALKKEEVLYSLREWKPPSSREKKKEEEKPKAKKEDESPRRKMAGKERAPRTQSEEKDNRKGAKTLEKEEPEVGKVVNEERARVESVPKKSRVKVKESAAASGDETVAAVEDAEEKDAASSRDSFDRGARAEGEDPPSKAKRRSLKQDEKDEKESLLGMSDSDESFTNDSKKNFNKEVKHNDIEIGDRVKVKYGRGRLQKVYEAKVLKIEIDGTEKRFYVHYAGWNTRYDEWLKKNYIVAIINSTKQTPDGTLKTSTSSLKKIDRGRPPGVLANTKPDRKNSTSSGSSFRATRSERKTLLSGGLEAKRRTRRKSGTSATGASQESDTDAMDEEDMSSSFKEALFSDDEEKDKLEDARSELKTRSELKKKSEKNRAGDKKEFTTTKRKFQQEENQNTDSKKESVKVVDKKRKKKKLGMKECSSSDEDGDYFKDKDSYLRQGSLKSDDPDMSLLCEEKVPGVEEDTSGAGTSTNKDEDEEEDDNDLPSVYPSCSSEGDRQEDKVSNTVPNSQTASNHTTQQQAIIQLNTSTASNNIGKIRVFPKTMVYHAERHVYTHQGEKIIVTEKSFPFKRIQQ